MRWEKLFYVQMMKINDMQPSGSPAWVPLLNYSKKEEINSTQRTSYTLKVFAWRDWTMVRFGTAVSYDPDVVFFLVGNMPDFSPDEVSRLIITAWE